MNSKTYSSSVSESIYTYDANLLSVTGNTYTTNAISNGHAVLDIIGVPRVYIYGETFKSNSDATKESLGYFNTISTGTDDISLT